MPRGKKTCPKCGLETGARAKDCQCGHQFSSPALEPTAKIKVKADPTPTPIPVPISPSETSDKEISLKSSIQSPLIYAPAGNCPVKPEGFKKGWPDGPASKEVIVDWIFNVLNSSNKNYTPHAVIYWAYQFWDINGPNRGEDYKRVRSVIVDTLIKDENAKLEFLF